MFGLDAKWIPAELRSQAELSGATVVDRASVVTTHLAEVVTQHAARLLGREDVRLLTDVVKRTHPVVVEELTPAQLSLGEVQRVLQALLDEGVSIRDLVRIFEALSLRAARDQGRRRASSRPPARRSARPSRRRTSCDDGRCTCITLRPAARAADARGAAAHRAGPVRRARPRDRPGACSPSSPSSSTEVENRNMRPVLVCAPQMRAAVRRLVQPIVPRLAVLSYQELAGADQIRSEGVVAAEVAAGGPGMSPVSWPVVGATLAARRPGDLGGRGGGHAVARRRRHPCRALPAGRLGGAVAHGHPGRPCRDHRSGAAGTRRVCRGRDHAARRRIIPLSPERPGRTVSVHGKGGGPNSEFFRDS